MTFIILKVISLFTPLRMPDEELEIGDLAVHGEEAYPSDEGFERVQASASHLEAQGGVGTIAPPSPTTTTGGEET